MLQRLTSKVIRRCFLIPAVRRMSQAPAPMQTELPSIKELNKKMSQTLQDTLKEEVAAGDHPVIAPKEWNITRDGTNIVLSRKVEIENIQVIFDVNDINKLPNFSDNSEFDMDNSHHTAPLLTIKVSQPGKGTLCFRLAYDTDSYDEDDMDYEEEDEEEYEDEDIGERPMRFDEDRATMWNLGQGLVCEIVDISFYDDKNNMVYRLQNEMAEEEFLVNMATFLKIRGVDTDFLKIITSMSTKIDNEMYIEFLKGLKKYFS